MPQSPSVTPRYFFKGQFVNLFLLIFLLCIVFFLVDFKILSEHALFGIRVKGWFMISLIIPILHQLFVWISWRSELCFGFVTKQFGLRGFMIYRTLFFILFLARPVSLILLTIVDQDSFEMSVPLRILICLILAIPSVYTFYSVARYFGMSRASGADHFDEKYRHLPMVNQGIFRFTNNAMYTYAFLIFWLIPVAGASWLGLVVAFFSHSYIWVHYFCTEQPDMKVIYGKS